MVAQLSPFTKHFLTTKNSLFKIRYLRDYWEPRVQILLRFISGLMFPSLVREKSSRDSRSAANSVFVLQRCCNCAATVLQTDTFQKWSDFAIRWSHNACRKVVWHSITHVTITLRLVKHPEGVRVLQTAATVLRLCRNWCCNCAAYRFAAQLQHCLQHSCSTITVYFAAQAESQCDFCWPVTNV